HQVYYAELYYFSQPARLLSAPCPASLSLHFFMTAARLSLPGSASFIDFDAQKKIKKFWTLSSGTRAADGNLDSVSGFFMLTGLCLEALSSFSPNFSFPTHQKRKKEKFFTDLSLVSPLSLRPIFYTLVHGALFRL